MLPCFVCFDYQPAGVLTQELQLLGLSDVGPVKPEPKLILQPQNSADDDSDDEDQPNLPQFEVILEENTG